MLEKRLDDAMNTQLDDVTRCKVPIDPPPQPVQWSKTIPPREFRWVKWVGAFVVVTAGFLIYLVALSYAGPAMPR